MKKPRINMICVGTELLTGKVNTHTATLGQKLSVGGFSLQSERTVGDDKSMMRKVFTDTWNTSDVVICAGGLGPTFDDITREVWATVAKRKLELKPHLVSEIEAKFKARGISMPPQNKRQGYILNGGNVIPNPNGTAPGQFLQVGKKSLFLLPGPARELIPMVDQFVFPRLKSLFPSFYSLQKSFHIFGVPESQIDEIIRPLVNKFQKKNGCSIIHGILASQSIITVKFNVEGRDQKKISRVYQTLSKLFRKKLKDFSFGEDGQTLPQLVGEYLLKYKSTLAVAESCTGGMLSKLLTDKAGASQYFIEGAVTYSNQSKEKRLGVSDTTLEKWGAVSEQTASEMAAGLRKILKTTYSISITGIAGPEGGTDLKPVGLCFIGISFEKKTDVFHFVFKGDRDTIRTRASLTALHLLLKKLISRSPR